VAQQQCREYNAPTAVLRGQAQQATTSAIDSDADRADVALLNLRPNQRSPMPKIISIDDKLLTKLPPREVASRLMALPARKRLDLILERTDAEEVIAALPEQDFYLTVKELGEQSGGPLLALARPEQLNHLLDIECWQRDELMPGKALAQLEEIAVASGEKFLGWLYQADFELLVLLFKNWLDVELIAEEDDYQELQAPRHTLDGQYYFSIRYPEYEELIKSTLGYLFENQRGFYSELMNHVLTCLETEVAELAYRFHRGRLEDNGIPDFSASRTIYRPLPPARMTPVDKGNFPADITEAAPTFALALVQEQSLLAAALAAIENQALRQVLQTEIATLANKIVMADELDPAEAESLHQAAQKAGAYVNLSLDLIASGEINRAAAALQSFYLEDLFRHAHGKIDQVRSRLSVVLKEGTLAHWPHGLNLLDQEWLEPASILLAKTPMILRQQADSRRSPGEDFIRSTSDLRQAERLVDVLAAMQPLFAAVEQEWQGNWDRLGLLLWNQGQITNARHITLGALLLTAAAWQVAGASWRHDPLPVAAWPMIFPRLTPERLETALHDHCRQLLADEEQAARAVRYFEPVLARYRTETGSFGPGQLPDPKLVPFFLFTIEPSPSGSPFFGFPGERKSCDG
jgi:hypothetical protein